ncbi:unnamed protein product [Rhizophagus irregularis]|uniref:Uncharacterized protein n=1 Tax=Rhizophagus irregularis TaxID=588596 RepID=A0A916EHF2_9GLOM|nr:unnamed protein product [Rhizophagus irregularis]
MEPKNQDLKGEKNGITNLVGTPCRVTKPGGYIEVSDRRNGYDGEGPIFRKVSEAFCLSTDKMIQILIIQVNVKEFYFIIYFTITRSTSAMQNYRRIETFLVKEITGGSLFFKNESVALLCGSLLF